MLENADDLKKLANLDWTSVRQLHSVAGETAAATLRNLPLGAGERRYITELLDAGDTGAAFAMFRTYAGTHIHNSVAQAWNDAGLISARTMERVGVDVPMPGVTARGIPLPLELHPNTTYSFGDHIKRDYPSYLTITYPSVTFDQVPKRLPDTLQVASRVDGQVRAAPDREKHAHRSTDRDVGTHRHLRRGPLDIR